jgi:hypothetical protein
MRPRIGAAFGGFLLGVALAATSKDGGLPLGIFAFFSQLAVVAAALPLLLMSYKRALAAALILASGAAIGAATFALADGGTPLAILSQAFAAFLAGTFLSPMLLLGRWLRGSRGGHAA